MYQTLLVRQEGSICYVTINRPEKLNALNNKVIEELSAVMDHIYADPAIRVTILTGAGEKAFVAGADISEFRQLNAEGGRQLAAKGQQQVFDKIEQCPKPVIAAVNGFALGGGCELAMACHFRLAAGNAQFGQPEVTLGLIPGYGGTQRLTQLIGRGRALELLMTGAMIDAATALQYGLVNYVLPPAELMVKCEELANLIITRAPLAVAGCIKAVNAWFDNDKSGYATEIATFGELFDTADAKEGATAFMEKRKPVFKGQ